MKFDNDAFSLISRDSLCKQSIMYWSTLKMSLNVNRKIDPILPARLIFQS